MIERIKATLSIDLYCRVVDNFGDAGICWRLARQLALEHGVSVRLIIDRPEYVSRLEHGVSDSTTPIRLAGVEVLDWSAAPSPDSLPAVVITAFQCRLPSQLENVLNCPRFDGQPLWINLDYLSAEAWVDNAHGLPSHKPSGGTEWFFIPGLTDRSGGLIREADRPVPGSEQDSEQDHGHDHEQDRERRCLASPIPDAYRVSIFCYTGQDLGALIEAWNQAQPDGADLRPIDLLITAGCDVDEIRRQLRIAPDVDKAHFGVVELNFLPWMNQRDFDLLLASCDLNFVRGEDSWIRAIWAGKPFIWRPYPQDDGADRVKLDAFLERCRGCFDAPDFEVFVSLTHRWRQNTGFAEIWPKWLHRHAELASGFNQLSVRLKQQEGLAGRLITFVKRRLL